MEALRVEITEEDWVKWTLNTTSHCPLETALLRQGYSLVEVGIETAKVNHVVYEVDQSTQNLITWIDSDSIVPGVFPYWAVLTPKEEE